jgi:hypothetical protein
MAAPVGKVSTAGMAKALRELVPTLAQETGLVATLVAVDQRGPLRTLSVKLNAKRVRAVVTWLVDCRGVLHSPHEARYAVDPDRGHAAYGRFDFATHFVDVLGDPADLVDQRLRLTPDRR